MTLLRLTTGRIVRIRPITDPRVVIKVMKPFAKMARTPPEDAAEQAHMTAAIALALSPFVEMPAIQLADHMTAYPKDAPLLTAAVLGDWVKR